MALRRYLVDNTRGHSRLDKIFTRRPDLIRSYITIDSLIKSDHKAVVVNSDFTDGVCTGSSSDQRVTTVVYDRLPLHISKLTHYSWSGLANAIDSRTVDVNTAFNDFYKVMHWHMWRFIPRRTVRVKSKDPAYITPFIKLLLRKRNRLYRRGHIAAGDQLALKINGIIAENRKRQLCSANCSDISRLGAMLRRSSSWGTKTKQFQNCGSVDKINNYFASVATDNSYMYCRDAVINELSRQIVNPIATPTVTANYTADHIAICLSRIRKTTTGQDELPFWIFKDSAFELSYILAKLINFTINEGTVPSVWKHSVIRPIPKVNPTC